MTDAIATSVPATPSAATGQSWTEALQSAPKWARDPQAAAVLEAHWRAKYSNETPSEYMSVFGEYASFEAYLKDSADADGGSIADIMALATGAEPQYTEKDEKEALRAWTKHAKNAAASQIEQGLAGLLYIRARLAIHPDASRDVAVKSLRSAAEEHSDSPVDLNYVNKLLRHAAAWEILSPSGPAKFQRPGSVAIRVISQWSPLVTRVEKSRTERWSLPTGYEATIKDEWAKFVAAELTSVEAKAVVARITAQRLTDVRQAAESAWTADRCTRTDTDLVGARKAELVAWKDADEPAPAPTDAALAFLKGAGIETPADPAPAPDDKGKGSDKGTQKTKEPANPAPTPSDSNAGIPPLELLAKSARASGNSAKATADFAAELVAKSDAPCDVVEHLLPMLAEIGGITPAVRAALAAAAAAITAALKSSKAKVA